ncbi:hypothetical protein ACFPZ0_12520 [Streptomonospora nanhaiensis]|uniref:Uncharacterized protein n=1 Tax=Streptomonospora nanhaiensis TaxID=1323731 RepID=A0A853BQ90_9ACTN|nr:hypothetical protein [Streptomonospora nanhaiensis]MBV2362806.1 hypothetical protein [Streptomonospora nanhaiensis]MBX9386975.1 hypothetical protein [Streptomonospora nanhaiensis]NYI97839.1 hypothetical protein [Streptomonospora nanhaiensis]
MGTLSTITGSAPVTPAQAVHQLHGRLMAAGWQRMYAGELGRVALLSLRPGLTVWCWGGQFRWRDSSGAQVTHPAADPDGVARLLGVADRPLLARTAA